MKHPAIALSAILAALIIAPASTAFEVKPVQRVNGLEWLVETPWTSAKLVVSGPGGYLYSRQFEAGESLFLNFDEVTKAYSPNGSYRYELVLSPALSAADRKLGEQARDLGLDAAMVTLPSISGSFRVSDGAVVDGKLPETTTKDQVFLDDVIVDGSLCVGVDCNNGESFGFDTIRLKENNLRIKFDDTSSTASFPNNDWQITINDSSNGGANKFSIDDITGGRIPFTIEAGTPSNALYVDSSGSGGRIGFGTSTPVADLHVRSGNTPTLRLEQDGSSGFAAQTWDVAGNEANFFVRDATNGSTLPLRIRPGADTDTIDLRANGDVWLGANTAAKELKIDSLDGPGNYGQVTFRRADVDEWGFGNTDANFYIFNYEGSHNHDALLINRSTGNVTITHDLTISGQCTEVDGPCAPDYVFAPGYQLRPLDELQSFITANRHLPDIPSAEEIHRGGINMREFNFALLEKVEELVLYTLDQQQTIKLLSDRVATLESGAEIP